MQYLQKILQKPTLLKCIALFRRFDAPLILLACSIGMTAVLMNLEFNLLEANLYDLRMSRGPQKSPDSRIVLVTIDDNTTKGLDQFAPLKLESHVKFLEALASQSPAGIGYIADLNRAYQDSPEATRAQSSQALIKAVNDLQSKGSAFVLGTPFEVNGESIPPAPLSELNHAVALIHKDGNVFAEDKVTRRALLSLYRKPVFHTQLLEQMKLIGDGERPSGTFYAAEAEADYFFFKYHRSPTIRWNEPFKLPYERYSYIQIMDGGLPPDTLKGKIVLIAGLSREDSRDFAFTPYSKTALANPKIVIHANIIDSLMNRDSIVRAPVIANWIATFLLVTSVIWFVLYLTPLFGVMASLSVAVGFITVALFAFSWGGIWIRMSQPLAGIFLSYYLAVPFRLIREYKRRWDYQKKNQLLVQVEELKTNFLNLVTHDLKTPVARIQGLAELVLRRRSNPSVEKDDTKEKEALNSIMRATEDLNRFITSILDITKVETNKIELTLESKDINLLIERCIEDLKPQAENKRIQIVADLDALFPIRFDQSLIRKVLCNVIDNAIKYSSEHSEVTVRSREVGEWIQISVTDQGVGLSPEDQDSLFKRFFRAKNPATAQSPGTGLGLYLTKYFIEAHHGSVSVESKLGKGTVFTIYLPVDIQKVMPGLTKAIHLEEKKDVSSTRS